MRRRVTIQDLGLLLAVVLVVAYLVFEVEIFLHQDEMTPEQAIFLLDEAMLVGGILALGLLIFAARRYNDLKREVVRRAKAEREARILAYQDPLTGLPNRRQFEEALRMAAASPPKSGAVHAVLLLDLNGFKQVNDNYGHAAGDAVLVVAAQRLMRAVREGDLVGRLGGDEFIVLAQHLIGPEAVTNVALRIIQGLAEPVVTAGGQHDIGAGIGIALLPNDAQTAEDLIRKADVALYRAKAERRSAFRFFEEEMDVLVRERGRLERDLRTAMELDQIQPRFRPSFDLRSGAVIGFEAIPNWISADGKEVPLDRFLAVAEETGLIHAMARRVLAQACATAALWPTDVALSIDIFPGQLNDPELGRSIMKVLEETGLEPGRLEIEITESMIVHDFEEARSKLGPLRAAGVRIALDNFGTGYSNIYHMREFKFDKVKIDRRFVGNMEGEEATKVIRALAGLGHGLGLAVSAEGIPGTLKDSSLIQSGVDEGQSSGDMVTGAETQRFFAAT
ncbi:putative bifunctional diguanylate cyclase/phosphodiesterase [Neomesorhizobium albiziae]|uniref:putative bifunctional diguanylate cyclase/phosphodiesterase n=1 Tax=Neomesorhizobium albiziae TaxID=335020 RepID=UPI00122D1352|nr:EAL domain-containing protein [Mesorhizobium albiziae]GLS32099.1 hypothetical protein GCM10007937_38090 [Mesorhizobium albiziae]